MIAIIQWGYYALAQQSIPNDTTFTVTWPILPAAHVGQRDFPTTRGFERAREVGDEALQGLMFAMLVFCRPYRNAVRLASC
jgi:hypothetical protein